MAECPSCQKYVPEGVKQCPHCQTPLVAEIGGVSPFQARADAARSRKTRTASPRAMGRIPASRLAIFGCLGIVALLIVSVLIFSLAAPDTFRTLLAGKPTPLPPTRRPTPTPSPVPSPTAPWTEYHGPDYSVYSVDLPPNWVVVNFAYFSWERVLRFEGMRYSWLEAILSGEQQQDSVEKNALWAFDPSQGGQLYIQCRLEPQLAGLTVTELQRMIGQRLLAEGHSDIRAEQIQLDGREALRYESIHTPSAGAEDTQPTRHLQFILSTANQAYWIEVVGPREDLERDSVLAQVVADSFRNLARASRQDDQD